MSASSGWKLPAPRTIRLAHTCSSSRSKGMTLRTPLAPYRTESNKLGRRFVKLNEGDKVVMVAILLGEEESIFLASADGHIIHFRLDEINVLSGVGKGVIGIKLDDGDKCLGGALITRKSQMLQVETSGGSNT